MEKEQLARQEGDRGLCSLGARVNKAFPEGGLSQLG